VTRKELDNIAGNVLRACKFIKSVRVEFGGNGKGKLDWYKAYGLLARYGILPYNVSSFSFVDTVCDVYEGVNKVGGVFGVEATFRWQLHICQREVCKKYAKVI